MDLITDILHCTPMPHDQRLTKIRLDALPLRVDSKEVKFLPGAVDDVLDADVELAGHDDGVIFAGEGVEMLEGDAIDFVVDVEAFDVAAVVFHDYVDEVVDGDVFVADEDFTVEEFVVAEDVVDHLG